MPNHAKRTKRNDPRPNRTRAPNGRRPDTVELGHLSDLVGYALRRAQIVVFRDFLKSFARYKIRPIQYGVLTVIERNPGLKQSHVCAALGIKRANFVTLLDHLERRGLTKRERAVNDQRANALYLTAKGKALLRELRTVNKTHEMRIAGRLSGANRRRLIRLLNDVIATAAHPG